MSSSLLHSQTQGKLRRGKRLIPSSCITSALPAISLCTVILSAAKNPEGHDHPSNSDPFQPESQPPLPLLLTYCVARNDSFHCFSYRRNLFFAIFLSKTACQVSKPPNSNKQNRIQLAC